MSDSIDRIEDDGVPSSYESGSASSPVEPPPEEAVSIDRARGVSGSDGRADVRCPSEGVAEPAPAELQRFGEPGEPFDGPEPPLDPDADQIAQVVLQKLEAHLHLPMETPNGEALAELKRNDPEAHAMWLRQVEKQLNHQRRMEAAPYDMPFRIMKSAHRSALVALAILTGLAAYALYLDRPWFAAFFAALDLVAVIAVFAGAGTEDGRTRDEG